MNALSEKFSCKYGWEFWLLHGSQGQELWSTGLETVRRSEKCSVWRQEIGFHTSFLSFSFIDKNGDVLLVF